MTDHIWTHERIAAFLADGLDAMERERFETHMRDCADCFTALEAARAFDGGLANLFASVRPSAMLEDRTLRAIREPKIVPARPMSRWGRRALMGLAATLVIGAFGAVTSFVIANGGLPMPGESFAWGTGPNSPLPERTRGVLRFGGGDDDEGTVPTAGEMAENLQKSLHRKFAIEDQTVDVKSSNGVASTSSTWYSTFGDQTFDAGVVDSATSPKTWDRRSGGQPNN
ncbi:MAG: zf-HC2 domain-containing protein, partial [Planctomycetia bacterium]|nr:zf-HC2 domain-containing protein [Planctomycetia bacterium]